MSFISITSKRRKDRIKLRKKWIMNAKAKNYRLLRVIGNYVLNIKSV